MKRRRAKWVVLSVSLVLLLALLFLCLLGFSYNRRLEQARLAYAPPTVYITEPAAGMSAPAGSQLAVSAAAWGSVPISRTELWLNGQQVDTQESDVPEGVSPFYAHFGLLVSEGPQQLVVRAVDMQGMIGQSVPIGVNGQPATGEGLAAVIVGPEQTLEDIAAANDTEPEALRELNPGLGDEEPSTGTEVIVPSPPSAEPPLGPTIPSSPGTPTVTGTVPIPPDLAPLPPIAGSLPQLAIPVFTPPAAPSGLSGTVKNCLVRLSWKDNSADELRYDVWMAPLAGSPQLIAQLTPAKGGAAWYQFPAPCTGGLSFWVEAVNLVGKQPSNVVWLEVDPQCPTRSPASLAVEAVDMSLRGNYDRVYCYMSFENAPENRLPGDDSAFIQVQSGQGDIASLASGNKKFLVPIPGDGTLDLSGECWGWSGEELAKLGTFSDSTNSTQWTGARRPLAGGGYEIGYRVAYASQEGGEGELTTYGYEDPSIPAPYNLKLLGDPNFTQPLLQWDWTGDEKTITGFAVFLDGQPFNSIGTGKIRFSPVNPPTACGKRQNWQVAAVAGERQSRLSAAYEYRTEECPVSVEVIFDRIEVICVDTSWFHPVCPSCDTVDSWFYVFANNWSAQRFSFNFPMKLSCQTWNINWAQWPAPRKNSLTVQIWPRNTSLRFGSRWFYVNDWGELAKFQQASQTITMSLEQWKTYQGEHELWSKQAGVYSYVVVKIRPGSVSVQ